MQSLTPDLDAPIVPGISAGGILIGHIAHLRGGIAKLSSGREIVDQFQSLKVWSAAGRVIQVGVYDGYRGLIEGRIGIGSSIVDIEEWCGCSVTEDAEDNLIVAARPGWCFETEPWTGGHSVTMNRNARVTAIFVHRL
jgi:hypothetical protein